MVILKGTPCKVIEINSSKAGKHGAAKVIIKGFNIFNDKKVEDSTPSTHNIECPIVVKREYKLAEININKMCILHNDDHIISLPLPSE